MCTYTDYRSNDYNSQIKNVYFVNRIAEEGELNSIAKWDLSSSKDESIMAWLKANEDESTPYDLYIGSEEKIKVRSFANAFDGLENVELINLNPSILDTSNLTDTSSMFSGCISLTNITDLKNLDVLNVTNMSSMFNYCGISQLDLSNWNTHKVTDMSSMFAQMTSLTEIMGIEDLDVSNVTNMKYTFSGFALDDYIIGNKISTLDLSSWDTKSVTDMSQMFEESNNLTNLDMRNATFNQVTEYHGMFVYTNSALKVTITGDANKQWFIDNNVLEEEKLNVLSE